MSAKLEEVVVQPHTPDPKHLGKQRAQHRLRGRARRPVHASRTRLRRRQRPPVELAVLCQRQTIQNHERRRHHVVRQRGRQRRAKLRHVRRGARGRHHVTHQPRFAVRRAIRARHHGRRRNPGLPHQQRLDLARLDPEPAQLHLRVRSPQELQHTVRTPPRQVPGPVHPRAGPPVRIGDKPLRGQTRAVQVTPRKTKPRDVKLAHTPAGTGSRPESST